MSAFCLRLLVLTAVASTLVLSSASHAAQGGGSITGNGFPIGDPPTTEQLDPETFPPAVILREKMETLALEFPTIAGYVTAMLTRRTDGASDSAQLEHIHANSLQEYAYVEYPSEEYPFHRPGHCRKGAGECNCVTIHFWNNYFDLPLTHSDPQTPSQALVLLHEILHATHTGVDETKTSEWTGFLWQVAESGQLPNPLPPVAKEVADDWQRRRALRVPVRELHRAARGLSADCADLTYREVEFRSGQAPLKFPIIPEFYREKEAQDSFFKHYRKDCLRATKEGRTYGYSGIFFEYDSIKDYYLEFAWHNLPGGKLVLELSPTQPFELSGLNPLFEKLSETWESAPLSNERVISPEDFTRFFPFFGRWREAYLQNFPDSQARFDSGFLQYHTTLFDEATFDALLRGELSFSLKGKEKISLGSHLEIQLGDGLGEKDSADCVLRKIHGDIELNCEFTTKRSRSWAKRERKTWILQHGFELFYRQFARWFSQAHPHEFGAYTLRNPRPTEGQASSWLMDLYEQYGRFFVRIGDSR